MKNVEAFEKLVGICSGYGGYNPGMSNLTIQSLTNRLINAKQTVDDANVAKSNLDKESNNREVAFGALPKLASSIVFTLAASDASEQTLNDARFFLRQLTGRKRSERKTATLAATNEVAATPQDKVNRSPQTNYVSRASNFGRLVQLVSTEPNYQPNEEALTLTGLNGTMARILQMNSNVMQAHAHWSEKKMTRNKALYANDSLLKTSRKVKKYVRAVFGLNSPEYQQIFKISFTKQKV